ncbi:MAG: hypothetical protein A2Y62_22100 [Candidatus Fischerbacteria bacterium RBG_13_37_8]|uniref:Uncharacterized protein n=1 Tax=Candidatus Fischerbacteria bacterium RBG_13_37_8 TaxID=1817863 RepID=A0A1F5VX11_9BACT|nr:MAG: hypothetical protein A2Y62_22100 [Candidatus Fischerbacteria bacterium RBG_13_37_8]
MPDTTKSITKSHEKSSSSRTVVVLISKNTFGSGPEELGQLLLRNFIKNIKEASPVPVALIFVNTGVHLTTTTSPLIDDLKEMEVKGSWVLSCGTCLDYFKVKEKLLAGKPSNMTEIVSLLLTADHIVAP